MSSRTWAGHALTTLRELNQLALTFTDGQGAVEARIWREEVSVAWLFRSRVVVYDNLIDCFVFSYRQEKRLLNC